MINIKKYWNDFSKKFLYSKGRDVLRMEITPYRDWRILVGVFFVGLVLSLGFNIYMSFQISNDNFFVAVSKTEAMVTLNKEGLAKVLKGFDDKKAAFEEARNKRSQTVDPSL